MKRSWAEKRINDAVNLSKILLIFFERKTNQLETPKRTRNRKYMSESIAKSGYPEREKRIFSRTCPSNLSHIEKARLLLYV